MSDRARDVWVEHLVTTYMDMSQPDWNHQCASDPSSGVQAAVCR